MSDDECKIDFELVKKYNKYLNNFNTKVPKKYLEMLYIKRNYYRGVKFYCRHAKSSNFRHRASNSYRNHP